MKPKIIVICLIAMLIGMTGCQGSNNNAGDQEDQLEETIPVEAENQLPPHQEQTYDADFETAYKDFTDAVNKKDLAALDAFLDDEILTSYGVDSGKANFYEFWHLNTDPDQSALWTELSKIISIGGTYSKEDRTFIAPYVYSDFPDKINPIESFAVISPQVNVYEEKDLASNVIAYLSYNIIKLDESEFSEYWNKSDQDLIYIETPSGKKGYVQKQFLRSPMDYRLSIVNKNDAWKLTYLIAGD